MQQFSDDSDSRKSTSRADAVPGVREMLAQLISLPSISSASAEWDHSNEPVVRTLGEWLGCLASTT